MRHLWLLVGMLGLLLTTSGGSSAAMLNVVDGILYGASGVDIGGLLYDVEFLDGTCSGLFDGCDNPSDFVFTGVNGAAEASYALLDQVFLDGPTGLFDTNPFLTFGCETADHCDVITPTGVYSAGRFNHNDAVNCGSSCPAYTIQQDQIRYDAWAWYNTTSTESEPRVVFARWSTAAIPEPSTALLLGLGLGLVGLAGHRRL